MSEGTTSEGVLSRVVLSMHRHTMLGGLKFLAGLFCVHAFGWLVENVFNCFIPYYYYVILHETGAINIKTANTVKIIYSSWLFSHL